MDRNTTGSVISFATATVSVIVTAV